MHFLQWTDKKKRKIDIITLSQPGNGELNCIRKRTSLIKKRDWYALVFLAIITTARTWCKSVICYSGYICTFRLSIHGVCADWKNNIFTCLWNWIRVEFIIVHENLSAKSFPQDHFACVWDLSELKKNLFVIFFFYFQMFPWLWFNAEKALKS